MLTPVHQHWRLVEIWRSGYGQSSVWVCVCVYRQSRGQSIRSVVFREGNRVIDNSHYSRILPGWDQVTKALRTQSGKWSEVFFFFFWYQILPWQKNTVLVLFSPSVVEHNLHTPGWPQPQLQSWFLAAPESVVHRRMGARRRELKWNNVVVE